MATQTLLQLKGKFYRALGTYRALTATGGSTSKFTVASLADVEPNKYAGWQLYVLTGASLGDLRVLGAGPNALGELEPKRIFSSTGPASTHTAELWGNSIDGGTDLTALFNDVLSVARPYVPTQLTIVANQQIYDITSYVRDEDDVRRVFIRDVDASSVEPYHDRELSHWKAFVHRPNPETPFSTIEIKLDIGTTLAAVAANTLWMRHYKTLTAFATDASTVEAEYADWLAWEAVLRHAVDQMTQSKADKANWERLAGRASGQVQEARRLYMPYVPRYIRPFGASA